MLASKPRRRPRSGRQTRDSLPSSSYAYDALVLDGAFKQSLASIRSLGKARLRVATSECFAECDPGLPVAGFLSKYSSRNEILPSYIADAKAYGAAIVDFVRRHPTRVVLPTMDGSIATLMAIREQLAEMGCTVALATNTALEVANDKHRTLELAAGLGIYRPQTVRIDAVEELPTLLATFEFPFVLKPRISWAAQSATRLAPIEVVNEREAAEVSERFLTAGVSVLGQQLATGRREGVTLFLADGNVVASCAHAALRTTPALGGASVMRVSIPAPIDILDSSVRLAKAIGLEGACEVEFRRASDGRPLLMEINARLAGTIKNSVHSGVDFPLLAWKWAAGYPLTAIGNYRTGIRTRWLRGDIRWLRDNSSRAGRPDSLPKLQAMRIFAADFVRTRHYDSVHGFDIGPVIGELRIMAAAARKARESNSDIADIRSQGAPHAR